MKRLLQIAACLAIAAGAAWATSRLYDVYVCNVRAKTAERRIIQLYSLNDEVTARIAARQILDDMDRCIPCTPTDVNQYMVRAAALRMLGRPDEAANDYRRAMRYDRRAELFLNLGEVELQAGREREAEDAFSTAVFLLYSYIDNIPEPMQTRVRSSVTPKFLLIQRGRAPQQLLDELRQRITRDPL